MSDLKRIVALATLMVQQQARVEQLKNELQSAQRDLAQIETEDLPELMSEVGLNSVTLEDGSVVEIKQDVQCGISEDRREAAHAWLIENGFGGLIKTEVVVAFGRGEKDAADEFSAEVVQLTGHHPTVKETVHAATLKSFVKEQLEAGVAIPFDTFAIHPFNKANLKPAKK